MLLRWAERRVLGVWSREGSGVGVGGGRFVKGAGNGIGAEVVGKGSGEAEPPGVGRWIWERVIRRS